MTSLFEREPLKLIINLREHFASRLSILNHNAQKFEIRLIEKDVEEKTDAVEKLFPFFRPEDRMILDDFIEELYDLEDRLKTRFEGGVMADVQPPDFETRMVIIKNKAAGLGLVLSDEAVEYIASKITANIRQLEGVIKKLTAYREILDEVITTESVKRAIEDVIKSGTDIPTPERIIKETARYYNLSSEDLKGQNRARNVTEARQVAMYLMRSLTNLSLKDIGEEFENRNHATVLSSIRKIEDCIKDSSAMSSKIRDISSNINS